MLHMVIIAMDTDVFPIGTHVCMAQRYLATAPCQSANQLLPLGCGLSKPCVVYNLVSEG